MNPWAAFWLGVASTYAGSFCGVMVAYLLLRRHARCDGAVERHPSNVYPFRGPAA